MPALCNLGFSSNGNFRCDNNPIVLKLSDAVLQYYNKACPLTFSIVQGRDNSRLPRCDIYVACPPCPDFAAKGTKLGTRTDRGKLIYAPLNYAKEKRPLAVCLENVHTLKTLFPEVYNELTKDPVYEQFWSCCWHLRRSQWVVAHGYE